jgi:tetratricopeptide (TPR) repeat protein
MLKIDAFNLATLPLGNSDNLKPGQKVLVIGAPLGLEYSISDGLFSSVRPEFYQETLQFTAPISPGNSGGPLLDMQGKVVGIVTYIKVGGSDIIAQNLNFAVSVNQAKTLIPTSPAVKFKVEEFRKNLENNYSNSILARQAEAYGKYEEALKYYRDALKGCYQPYNKECLWRIIDLLKLSAFLSYLSWQEKDYAKASHYSNGCINTIEAFGGPEYLIKEITKGAIFPGERLSKFKEHTVGTGYFLSGYLYLLNNDENGANRCKEKLKMFAPEAARNLEEGISEWQKEKNTVQFPKNMGPYGKKEFISEEKAKFPAEEDIRIIENLDLETGSLFGKAKDAFLKKENSLAIEYLNKTLSRLRKYSPEYNVIFKYKIVSHQQQAIDYGVKGLDDEAIKSYEKTISLIGSSQDAFLQEKLAGCYFGLGIIYARNRNRDKAEWCLRKLQELRTADSGESVNILGKEVYK